VNNLSYHGDIALDTINVVYKTSKLKIWGQTDQNIFTGNKTFNVYL